MDFDPYATLGVARSCDGETLKSAYRRLVRDNHPDVTSDKEAATVRMTQINAAWALVGDPQKRADFDLRQRFEERQKRERSVVHRCAPSPRPSSKSKPTPRTSNSSSTSKSGSSSEKRPAYTTSRHARLAEASRLLFKQNKPAEALEICRAILKTDFRNIPARELMGEAYLRLGQTERALAVWEQALVLAPNNAALRRRWMQLMSPQARSAPASPNVSVSAPSSAPPPKTPVSPPCKPTSPGLISRLMGRLKKR